MPVYDDQKEKVSAGDLEKITGINPLEQERMERRARAGADEDIAAQEREGLFNPDGDKDEAKQSSPEELKSAESTGTSNGKSLFKANDAEGGGFMQASKNKAAKMLKNKVFIGVAAVGGLSAGTIVMLIILALGMFKIPNFGEHLATYQFARTTRDYARTSNNITATKMAIDSADDGTYSQLKAKYAAGTGKMADQWSKLDKYRPNKIISNMHQDGTMKFNYETTKLGRQRLTSVTMNGKDIPVEKPTLGSRLIPGVQFKNNVSFAREFAPELQRSMVTADAGRIIRGITARKLRQELGISLIAWEKAKYANKTADEAKIQIEQDSREKIKGGADISNPKVSQEINDTAEKANAAEEAALNDPTKAAEIIANPNELPTDVAKVLDDAFVATSMKSIFDKILGVLNPIYAVATPICMVYEGSLVNQGASINSQSAQAQRAFYMVMSGASQVKDGYNADGNAAGAMGWKLGDIENSNTELRASGKAVDTSKSFSTQGSPTGQFSIVDAIVPAPFDSVLNTAAKTCPAFTNVWVGAGLGIANVAIIIASLGTASAPEAGAEVAAQAAVKTITTRILEKVVASKTIATTVAKDTLKQGALIAGATLLAKMITLSQMGSMQSPLAVGVPFANEVDNGGNQQASAVDRSGVYGRPMTKEEVAGNNLKDEAFLNAQTSSQSAIARYLAPNNPDSMVTRFASVTQRNIGTGSFAALFNIGSSILNPVHSMASLASSTYATQAHADSTDTFNYGNVQWGYSPDEQAKLDIDPKTNLPGDPSYMVLENQRILDESGKQDEIESKYGPCYDDTKQAGDLLTEETGDGGDDKYFVVRDNDGNLKDNEGLCSPKNLSFNNPTYGDLVFRWRVAHSYDGMFDELDEAQNPVEVDTAVGGTANTAASGGDIVIGDTSNLQCAAGDDKGIGDGYADGKLYKIRLCDVQGILVNSQISGQLDQLLNASKQAGITMGGGGFRSAQEQHNARVANGCPNDTSPSSSCNIPTAPVGYSNHQMGLAVDFTYKGQTICFPHRSSECHGNDAFDWLTQNAKTYGLKNLDSESWHWSYDGT